MIGAPASIDMTPPLPLQPLSVFPFSASLPSQGFQAVLFLAPQLPPVNPFEAKLQKGSFFPSGNREKVVILLAGVPHLLVLIQILAP